MKPRRNSTSFTRRELLYLSGATLLATACSKRATTTTGAATDTTSAAGAPAVSFVEPRESLSGELEILLWSHFVPVHDPWFDPFVKEWGDMVGVDVIVDHIARRRTRRHRRRDPIGPARP